MRAAMEPGCDGFLPKPVRVQPLIDEVRRLLRPEAAVDGSGPELAD